MGARYSIMATRNYAPGTQYQSTPPPSDRAYNPNRVVSPFDHRPEREDLAKPSVRLANTGKNYPVGDLNWAINNAEHADEVAFERSTAARWDAIMKITGTNPEAGPFEFQVGWRDRNRMRDWTQKNLSGVPVADHLRDGGY